MQSFTIGKSTKIMKNEAKICFFKAIFRHEKKSFVFDFFLPVCILSELYESHYTRLNFEDNRTSMDLPTRGKDSVRFCDNNVTNP